MTALANRYDIVFFFDVQDGNPNGDPDAGNMPRVDPETGHGLVTDVCIKRKIRNHVAVSKQFADGFDIYVKEKAILTLQQGRAYQALGLNAAVEADDVSDELTTDVAPVAEKPAKGAKKAKKPKSADQAGHTDQAKQWMCQHFYDVRTFGAVMSLKENNAGQVRGAAQITFSRSIDPIFAAEHSITRMAVATMKEAENQGGDNRTMGRKATVPYGLYRGHAFVSPSLGGQTGFSEEDFNLFIESLRNAFEHDRSAARGLMTMRKILAFKHEGPLGNARAGALFDGVTASRLDQSKPARAFADYQITATTALPAGVTLVDLTDG